MEYERKRVLQKTIIDPVLLIILIVPYCILEYAPFISPRKTGFYCNDQSISYPFIGSKYPKWLLDI